VVVVVLRVSKRDSWEGVSEARNGRISETVSMQGKNYTGGSIHAIQRENIRYTRVVVGQEMDKIITSPVCSSARFVNETRHEVAVPCLKHSCSCGLDER